MFIQFQFNSVSQHLLESCYFKARTAVYENVAIHILFFELISTGCSRKQQTSFNNKREGKKGK